MLVKKLSCSDCMVDVWYWVVIIFEESECAMFDGKRERSVCDVKIYFRTRVIAMIRKDCCLKDSMERGAIKMW